MKLNHLTDQQLIKDLKSAVQSERAAMVLVLEHIQEVHQRKLFVELGYPSLFKYMVQALGYSEGQAYRRIQAARLVDKMPEVKQKIADGRLNLTKASKLQSFFSEQKDVSKADKLSLIAQAEKQSTRECELTLAKIKDPAATESFKLTLRLSQAQKQKWDQLQGRLAHQQLTGEALLEKVMDVALKALDPAQPKRVYKKTESSAQNQQQSQSTRSIAAPLKRAIWQRAGHVCESMDAQGKRCQSGHALEIDHVIPFALGGETALQNLKLLCRAHHQRKTVLEWGVRKS